MVFICVWFLTGGAAVSFAGDGCGVKSCEVKNGAAKVKDANNKIKAANDVSGPTVVLDYKDGEFKKNPVSSFMYFVPLISPVIVENEISNENKQFGRLLSYKKEVKGKTFHVEVDFSMEGDGYHKYTFDHEGMIERNTANLSKGESLKNILDYIKFEGDGVGQVEIEGTINGSKETVSSVNIHFNARGNRSTVTVGLYSIDPKDGKYKYENRYNTIVARVNILCFVRGEQVPRMDIKVASISSDEASNGWWSRVKGAIANLFIKPLEIEPIGNTAMLDFGFALLKKEPIFTFPKAENLREVKSVAASGDKKADG